MALHEAKARFKIALERALAKDVSTGARFQQHPIIVEHSEAYAAQMNNATEVGKQIGACYALNPSNPERTKLIVESTYIANRKEMSVDLSEDVGEDYPQEPLADNRLLPTNSGFEGLLEVLSGHQFANVMLTGYRGTGKTQAMNYFFAKYFDSHLKPNRITYFRCDASKLELIRAKLDRHGRDKGPVTIAEYLRAHNVYVVLKHGSNDPILEPFCREQQLSENSGSFYRYLCDPTGKPTQLCDFWMNWATHTRIEATYDEISAIAFLADYISAERRADNDLSERLSDRMLGLIHKHGGRIVLVIDGVDNYSQEEDGEIYDALMTELTTFFPRANPIEYDKVVLSLRELAYHDLLNRLKLAPTDGSVAKFTVGTVSPMAFLKHRIAALPNREVIGREHFPGVERWDAELLAFAARLLVQVRIGFGRTLTHATGDLDATLLRVVYGGNLRAFRRNVIQAFYYCRAIAEAYGRSLATLDKRIYLEAALLAGRPYMPATSGERATKARGRWCPNLLYYDIRTSADGEIWGGLAMTRLLQLLDAAAPPLALCEIQSQMKLDFGYAAGYTRELLLRALRYGLVAFAHIKYVDAIEGRDLAYTCSLKGKVLIRRLYWDVGLFYFMAASVRWPSAWCDDSRMVSLHHFEGANRQFFTSAIKTGVSMWRLLRHEHEREMGARKFENDSDSIEPRKRSDARYRLPSHRGWSRSASLIFASLYKRSPEVAEGLTSDLEGLVTN